MNLQSPMIVDAKVDFAKLRKDRYSKVQVAMQKHGTDLLVLTRPGNSLYATGTQHIGGLAGWGLYFPIVTVIPAQGAPWIFTTDPDGVAPEVPVENTFGPVFGEFPSGVDYFVNWLKDTAGARANGAIGVDTWTAALHEGLPARLPKAKLVNGESVLADAKKIKTEEEKKLLITAEMVGQAGLHSAIEHLRPGVRELELARVFARRVMELGHSCPFTPTFCGEPVERAQLPHATTGVIPYRKLTQDRILTEGELVAIDCGTLVQGYAGDIGRTWYCGNYTKPTDKQKGLYKIWRETMDRILDNCKPGKTTLDLLRAVGGPQNITSYVGHGLGIGSPDLPIIGGMTQTEEEHDKWVLEPNMVLCFEPTIFREGIGSYRGEEAVFITETGYQMISGFPMGPLAEP